MVMEHDFDVRVYYEDTDAGGVVYHANYLKFCERARSEYLRALGFENSRIYTHSNSLIVVKKIEADYMAPARLDDLLCVRTHLIEIKNTSFFMRQNVLRHDKILFAMKILLVFVNDGGKPVKIPLAIRQVFDNEIKSHKDFS